MTTVYPPLPLNGALPMLGATLEVGAGGAEGTSFIMRFPANFTLVPAVILESAGERYALRQLNLVETLSADGQNIDRSQDEPLLELGDRSLPLMTLHGLLAQDAAGASGEGTIAVQIGRASCRERVCQYV